MMLEDKIGLWSFGVILAHTLNLFRWNYFGNIVHMFSFEGISRGLLYVIFFIATIYLFFIYPFLGKESITTKIKKVKKK